MKVSRENNILAVTPGWKKDKSNIKVVSEMSMGRYEEVGRLVTGVCQFLKDQIKDERPLKLIIGYNAELCDKLMVKYIEKTVFNYNITILTHSDIIASSQLSFAIRLFSAEAGIIITPKQGLTLDRVTLYDQHGIYWSVDEDEKLQKYLKHAANMFLSEESRCMQAGHSMNQEIDSLLFNSASKYLKGTSIPLQRLDVLYIDYWGQKDDFLSSALRKINNSVSVLNKKHYEEYLTPLSTYAIVNGILREFNIQQVDMVLGMNKIDNDLEVYVKNNFDQLIRLDYNQLGVLTSYYYLTQHHRCNRLVGLEFITKSYFSTDVINLIAHSFGVDCIEVNQGYSQVEEIIQKYKGDKEFLFGIQDGGIAVGDISRGKDVIMMAFLLLKTVEWIRFRSQTVFDVLLDIYSEFGYFKETMLVLPLGKIGFAFLTYLKTNLPKEFDEIKVRSCDFSAKVSELEDTVEFTLEDRSKIKIHIKPEQNSVSVQVIVKAELNHKDDYHQVSLILHNRLKSLTDNVEKAMLSIIRIISERSNYNPIREIA